MIAHEKDDTYGGTDMNKDIDKLMNKIVGVNPKSRDKLPIWKLFDIDRLQYIAKTVIRGLLAKGEDYHLPYQKCKAAFETYARVAFIPQRLLEG